MFYSLEAICISKKHKTHHKTIKDDKVSGETMWSRSMYDRPRLGRSLRSLVKCIPDRDRCQHSKLQVAMESFFMSNHNDITHNSNRNTFVYKNSRPIPTCTPFLLPSLLLATSGTPKLTSTRTGLNLYISPRPTEIDGEERESKTIVFKDASAHFKKNSELKGFVSSLSK